MRTEFAPGETDGWIRLFQSFSRNVARVLVTALLILNCFEASAIESPQISAVALAGQKLNLTWTGLPGAYEIQTAADPASINWSTVLHTARTNALVPLTGTAGFLRVIATDPASASLVLTTTNVSSGDIFTVTRQAQTNGDLVFDNLANTNASVPVQSVLPLAERQKFDVAFDGAGGFSIVTSNGEPSGSGGQITPTSGPGASQTTYSGFITNGTDMVMFSAVAGLPISSSGVRPLESGGGDAATPGDVGSGAFDSVWCSPAWALQNLGCQAAAFSRTPGCVGFFPPKPLSGYGYISAKTGVTLVVTATNIILSGSCDSHCITCCKNITSGALSDCTQ